MRERVRESIAELARVAAAGRPGRARGGARPARVDATTTTSPSSATASTSSRTEDGEDVLRAVSGLRASASSAPDGRAADLGQLRAAAAGGAAARARRRRLLILTKANSRATVHRPAYLDYVGVKRFDDAGEVVGERRFLGLYTHTAYSASPWEIPLLRRKVAARASSAPGCRPGSHDDKALVEILETYPRDELFQISEDELFEIALGHPPPRRAPARAAVRPPRRVRPLRLLPRLPAARPLQHRATAQRIAGDPRRRRSTATSVDYTTRVSESVLARLHFVVYTEPGALPDYDVAELEARLAAATRAWTDDLRDALVEQLGEERAGAAASSATATRSPPPTARTSRRARRCSTSSGSSGSTPTATSASASTARSSRRATTSRFKLLRSGQPLLLSDVLPLLENMGVRVSDERPYEVTPRGRRRRSGSTTSGCAHDDGAELARRRGARDASRTRSPASGAARPRTTASTGSSSRRGSTAREVTVLRAIAKYLRQAGSTFSQTLHGGRARRAPRHRAPRSSSCSGCGSTRCASERHRREGAGARARARRARSTRSRASTRTASCAASSRVVRAVLRTNYFQTGRRRRAEAVPLAQARPDARPGPARAAAAVRDLRLLAARRGRAPARRARSRAAASAGPTAARTSAPRSSA